LGRLAVLTTAIGSMAGGVAVLGSSAPAGAVTHTLYVSPYGSDTGNNCRTQSAPCLTLKHANNIVATGDTIDLAPGTYQGNIEVTKDIAIVGTAAGGSLNANTTTIDGEGDPSDKITVAFDGVTASMSNLVIDGAYNIVGGIDINGSDLDLTNVVIEENEAVFGGGIYNDGDLTMTGGSISNNGASFGGGLDNDGVATLKNVSFTQDSALIFGPGEGGAIFNDGDLTLKGTNPIHNNSAFDGGGIEECPGKSISVSPGTSVTGNTPNDISSADPKSDC
jgi:hypothetical protein